MSAKEEIMMVTPLNRQPVQTEHIFVQVPNNRRRRGGIIRFAIRIPFRVIRLGTNIVLGTREPL